MMSGWSGWIVSILIALIVFAIVRIFRRETDPERSQFAAYYQDSVDKLRAHEQQRDADTFEHQAQEAIKCEPMYDVCEAATALGDRSSTFKKIKKYQSHSWLLVLPSVDGNLYPRFQFDPNRRRVHRTVRLVNERLGAACSPWGVASWWFSEHARLGTRPVNLVGGAVSGKRNDASSELLLDQLRYWKPDLKAAAQAITDPIG